jgi:hypothetical protein
MCAEAWILLLRLLLLLLLLPGCTGHVAMLADPTFAEIVQSIGQASLGADDKTIKHLTKVSPARLVL